MNFLNTYRAPLITLGVVLAAMLVDYRFRATESDSYSLGQQALAGGKYSKAIEEFSTALRQNPADSAARLGLGEAYQAMGWNEEAAKQFEMSVEKAAETLKKSYQALAKIAEKSGRKDEARTFTRSALALDKK